MVQEKALGDIQGGLCEGYQCLVSRRLESYPDREKKTILSSCLERIKSLKSDFF